MTDAATTTSRTAWGWGLATCTRPAGAGHLLPGPAPGSDPTAAAPPSWPSPARSAATTCAVCGPRSSGSRSTSTHPRPTPPTPTCGCTCSATGWSRRARINLDGIFGQLPNVVWTSAGPCAVEGFEAVRSRLRARHGHVTVFGVDKFPRMVDYVLPTGVRIADADRVRLGAHLAEGTTVMHEGFVNYNAGTLGTSMVEGRISAGVVVGRDSDVGGGASIMGTLSGGGQQVISVGERCLLGANAGHRHLPRRRLRRRGRSLRHRGHQGHAARRPGGQGPLTCRARAGCSSSATRSPARSRSAAAKAGGVELNAALHAN